MSLSSVFTSRFQSQIEPTLLWTEDGFGREYSSGLSVLPSDRLDDTYKPGREDEGRIYGGSEHEQRVRSLPPYSLIRSLPEIPVGPKFLNIPFDNAGYASPLLS